MDPTTTPPSSPQGPERNLLLTDEEYRKRTWPGDDPDQPAGEGSGARTRPSPPPEKPQHTTTSGDQASDDATVQHAPNNAGSTKQDPDDERGGGMSGGLGAPSAGGTRN